MTTKKKIIFVLSIVVLGIVLGFAGYFIGVGTRETFPEVAEWFREWFGELR